MHVYSCNLILHFNFIIWYYYASYSLCNDNMKQLNYALFSFMKFNFVILLNKIYCVDDDEFA